MEDEMMNITYAVTAPSSENDELPPPISASIDGVIMSVPIDPHNRHYVEIMRQVDAGTLVIDIQP